MGGALDLRGLIVQNKHRSKAQSGVGIRNGLTAGEELEGAVIFPSLFAISSNAKTASAACSRFPLTKLSIFFSTLLRIASVESVAQV